MLDALIYHGSAVQIRRETPLDPWSRSVVETSLDLTMNPIHIAFGDWVFESDVRFGRDWKMECVEGIKGRIELRAR